MFAGDATPGRRPSNTGRRGSCMSNGGDPWPVDIEPAHQVSSAMLNSDGSSDSLRNLRISHLLDLARWGKADQPSATGRVSVTSLRAYKDFGELTIIIPSVIGLLHGFASPISHNAYIMSHDARPMIPSGEPHISGSKAWGVEFVTPGGASTAPMETGSQSKNLNEPRQSGTLLSTPCSPCSLCTFSCLATRTHLGACRQYHTSSLRRLES
jgi:hypothetical protein